MKILIDTKETISVYSGNHQISNSISSFIILNFMNFSKKCTDNRKKNTKRKITQDVARKVQERDSYCIFTLIDRCKWNGNIEEIHHVMYWIDAQYDEWRNNEDRLVWLCTLCHDHLHSRWWKDYREHAKKYLWF